MSDKLDLVCGRVNDSLVVKCIEASQFFQFDLSDLITSLLATFSLFTAFFAMKAARAANKHNIDALKPWMILEHDVIDSGEGKDLVRKVLVRVKNIGNGPLIINHLDLNICGVSVIENNSYRYSDVNKFVHERFREILGDNGSTRGGFGWNNGRQPTISALSKDSGIGAGEGITILEFEFISEFVSTKNTRGIFDSIKVHSEYRDVFGNTFLFKDPLDTPITKN